MPNGYSQLSVGTLTKTKVNVQQAALVGIAAVCTAMLLGAFTANFAILATGGLRIATTASASCTNSANLACGKPVKYVAPKNSYYQRYTLDRGFVESNVTDGNLNTYGYTSDWKMGYEIDLLQPTDVNKIVITWKHWGFSPYSGNKMNYMRDYYVYGLSNGTWTKLAGRNSAPGEWTTTVTPATPVRVEMLRITSGWGLQVNGQWGTTGFNRAGNWLGLPEVEVYGPAVAAPTLEVKSAASVIAQDIPNDTNQVLLGGFDLTAGQEPVAITQLPLFLKVMPISVTPGTFEHVGASDIENVTLYDEQGHAVQGPFSAAVIANPDGSLEFSFQGTNHFTIPVGTNHYKLKGDISALVSRGTTIRAALKPNLIISRGQLTNQIVTPTPSTEVVSALMTVNFCSVVHIGNYSYHLEPCSLDIQMHDGGNAKPFSTRIIQDGGSASYGYVVYGYGVGFPTYGIVGDGSGGATGNKTIAEYFNDNVLSAAGNLPRVYQGYLPIRVDQNGVVKELRLTLKLTVLPPVCGDHNTDVGEFCDDGNTSNGDGCSATCQIEPGTTVCPRLNASNINPAIYYRLEPCSFDITFIDGQGDQLLDYTLIQEGGLMKFWYNVNGQVGMPSGYGTPVPAIGSVTSGSHLFTALLSDTYLNVTAPQTYEGYVPAKINFDNGNQTSTQLRLNVKIKALPASAAQPALKMTFDPVVPAQSVVAGSKNQIFAYVKLDASNSSENISVTQIQARVASVSPASPSQTSNWSIFDGQTELAALNDPDWSTSSQTATGTYATTTFTFNTPLVIATSTAKTLTIKADVATAATAGGVMVGCQAAVTTDCVRAKGYSSGTDATVTITPFVGNLQTFLVSGALTITVDASTPVARLISANTLGVTLASLKVAAQFEAIQIDKFYLTGEQVNNGGWNQVKKLYVYKGSTLLTEVTPTATDGVNRTVLVDLTNVRIDDRIVPKDGSIVLIFKADTPDVNYENSTNAVSGQGIRLKINGSNDVTARGAQSGTALFASVTAAAGNPQYLFRGMPQVGSMGKICAYGADGAGDIGLYSANGALEVVQAGSCSSIHTRSEFVSTNTPPNPLPDTVPHLQISGSQGLYWTDFWRTPTLQFASSTSTTTEQWMNGYLVPPQL